MYQSVLSRIDELGRVTLMEPLRLAGKRTAILTVLDEPLPGIQDTADASIPDPWGTYRARLSAAGLRVPTPGTWRPRDGSLIDVEGPPVSQTIIEERR